MKMIVAIIRPERLEAVQAALDARQVYLASVSQVLGDRREPGHTEIYRGRQFRVPPAKLRLEIVANDGFVDPAVEAIVRAGTTGRAGDGEVFVLQLAERVRICPDGGRGPTGIAG